jgi:hypothetical protein
MRVLRQIFNLQVYLVNIRKSMADRRVHAYYRFHIVYGRKPTLEEQAEIAAKKAEEAKYLNPSSAASAASNNPNPNTVDSLLQDS